MRDHEHPHPDLLLRFLSGTATTSEIRAIVRHLLYGCVQCAAAIRPVWALGDRRARWQAEPKPARGRVIPAKVLMFHGARG